MVELNIGKRKTQLAAARLKIAKSGMSPRQLGIESKQRILIWIYKWGFTTSTVAQLLLGRTSGGYLKRLTKQNLLIETKTKSGTPSNYYTLSELGLQEVERFTETLFNYPEIDPFKVNQLQIRHNLIAQTVTINALHTGQVINYETERMRVKEGDKQGVKRADVVWLTSAMKRYSLEIELSAKWNRILDNFILAIAKDLQTSKNNVDGISRYIVVTDSKAIHSRYSDAMQPGKPLAIWIKNDRNHWVVQKSTKVPDWLINHVEFILIKA